MYNFSDDLNINEKSQEKNTPSSESTSIYTIPELNTVEESSDDDFSKSDRENAYMALKYPSSSSVCDSDDSDFMNTSSESDLLICDSKMLATRFTVNGVTVLPCESSDEDTGISVSSKSLQEMQDEKINMMVAINLHDSKQYVEEWILKHHSNKKNKEEDEINR